MTIRGLMLVCLVSFRLLPGVCRLLGLSFSSHRLSSQARSSCSSAGPRGTYLPRKDWQLAADRRTHGMLCRTMDVGGLLGQLVLRPFGALTFSRQVSICQASCNKERQGVWRRNMPCRLCRLCCLDRVVKIVAKAVAVAVAVAVDVGSRTTGSGGGGNG